MRNYLRLISLSALLLWTLSASAQSPLRAECTRSANLLACVDRQSNAYSVMTAGGTVYLRGFEAASRRFWVQTSSRYGQLTFFTGVASDGESWVGYSQRVGWTTINRFASSGGSTGSFVCGRLNGCQNSMR
ncbi:MULTISPECIES: glutamine synthetase [Pseudomonas]|uniref:glutamine synthetase n=1 Tax=Pseudomonas TaxID=286 RepID=UPI001E5C1F69|nr:MULTISPECIES: glutamine synthetase [Pseudomonas]MCD4528129.1 glutamine synthetase [Pseudomonas sp. C3-2018]